MVVIEDGDRPWYGSAKQIEASRMFIVYIGHARKARAIKY